MGHRAPAQLGSQPALAQPPVAWGLGPTWLEDLVATADWDGLLGVALAWSRVSILGDIQNLPGHGPEQPPLADPALRREAGLDDIPSALTLL